MFAIGAILLAVIAIFMAMSAGSRADALAKRVHALEKAVAGPEPDPTAAVETDSAAEPDALPHTEEVR
jgi:hypothetical protein